VSRPPGTRSSRNRLFALITGGVPLVLLLALEGGLRAVGFGGPIPLFIPSSATPGFLEPNPVVATRLVADASLPPLTKIDTSYFRSEREEGSLRIVVQGGSSAAGFPYGRWGSLAGMLQHRLRRTFPGREVEVVGTAMSAVNSYALLDFAEEVIDVRPDAVLVYAGHNEYLGILGVGSSHSLASNRLITLALLRVRGLALFQALQRVRNFAKGEIAEPGEFGDDATLMARVVGEREIPLGSDLYGQGLAQFRANMGELLSRYREAGIPVYIGTLASNERHQAPFLSGLAEATDAASWQSACERARGALAKGDLEGAQHEADRVVALDGGSADAHYLRGQVLDARGEYREARVAYLKAKDLDLLRFRAPEAMNEIIRELAGTYGAVLVETQRAFEQASPKQIIGGDLILEHLHPNAEGYFVLADAFYDALAETRLGESEAGPGVSWESATTPDAKERRRNPITEIDRIAGENRIAVLVANWPFQRDATEVSIPEIAPTNELERLGHRMGKQEMSWTEAMQRALDYYREREDYEEAARVALNLAETYPLAALQSAEAGRFLAVLGYFRESETHFERAARLAPQSANVAMALEKVREQLAMECERGACD